MGRKLEPVSVMHTRWSDWKERHPETRVLSTDTGYARDYSRSPYLGYEQSGEIWFPVQARDDRFHPKEPVLGIEISGSFKAYPFVELEKVGGAVHGSIAGRTIVVKYDSRYHTAVAADDEGNPLPGVIAFWFAWYAFHPDTGIYFAEWATLPMGEHTVCDRYIQLTSQCATVLSRVGSIYPGSVSISAISGNPLNVPLTNASGLDPQMT